MQGRSGYPGLRRPQQAHADRRRQRLPRLLLHGRPGADDRAAVLRPHSARRPGPPVGRRVLRVHDERGDRRRRRRIRQPHPARRTHPRPRGGTHRAGVRQDGRRRRSSPTATRCVSTTSLWPTGSWTWPTNWASRPQAAVLGAFESDASHAKASALTPKAALLCLPTLSTHGYEVIAVDAIPPAMAAVLTGFLRDPPGAVGQGRDPASASMPSGDVSRTASSRIRPRSRAVLNSTAISCAVRLPCGRNQR